MKDQETHYIELLERIRWNGIVQSPFDPTSKVYRCAQHRYRCASTGKYFNVKTKTIFHNTKISIRQWFIAVEAYQNNQNISAENIARVANTSLKTAYHILRKLKKYNVQKIHLADDIKVEISQDYAPLSRWLQLFKP